MAVKPHELQNQERGMSIETRGIARAKAAEPEDVAVAELLAIRKRIEEARVTTPNNPAPHCSHCAGGFADGWRAALEAVEGKG